MKEPSLLDDDVIGWNDDTLMPFGKHKGTRMEDVPGKYLLWCYDQNDMMEQHKGLAIYIDNHLDEISERAETEQDEDDFAYGADNWEY